MAEPAEQQARRPADAVVERGNLKVFLGMAAGVGKTYRMLQEGRAEAEEGRDVVVGYLEPHGRKETVEQVGDLEFVPRRQVEYRDTVLEEMDLPAVISRSPDLALIDELAHTNPPGLEHEKRYQDVQDVLDAGIDVYSTVNIQHLESLNDSVCELTGVRVRETMPDAVLNDADEVVLMDLTPEALLDRLREGKIYPAERIDAALNNFFRIENLSALREVALRQVAQEVESKRMVKEPLGRREDRLADSAATQAVGERLLALIKPTPRAQRLVRRAFRSAQRLGADLDLLWVKKPGYRPTPEEQNQLDGIGRVAALLGAHLLVEEGDDLAQTVKEVAEEKGSTYVLIGTPKPRTGLDRFRPSVVSRLIESLPGVDLRVVADRALRGEEEP
jgi:two-component system sensor histidine kinase KdpD